MKKKVSIVLFILGFLCSEAQELAVSVDGAIKLIKKDNFLNLRAQIINKKDVYVDELTYNFLTIKKNEKGNYFKNNQSGDFSLSPKEEKYLSTVRISLTDKEQLRVFLFIKHKDKLLRRDTLFINVPEKPKVAAKRKTNQQPKQIDESQFFIKGVVIDEAITRIGKDFHDFFYQEYLVSGRKYPFIIKISEKPAMGRSSIIAVEAHGTKIHEFFAKPEEEYLKQNVALTMRRLTSFVRSKGNNLFNRRI